ncbi:hypothetical protein [Microcoleus sp. herbarium12]|uniref:hypothetical protein n=1 Tax=Microcoleus sp. herbarium12 TaxID=3055437 RepID=UPI002FD27104
MVEVQGSSHKVFFVAPRLAACFYQQMAEAIFKFGAHERNFFVRSPASDWKLSGRLFLLAAKSPIEFQTVIKNVT